MRVSVERTNVSDPEALFWAYNLYSGLITKLSWPVFLSHPLVDRLAPAISLFYSVPEINPLLAQFPAQKDDFAVNFARKIQKSDIQVFDLYTDGIDLGDCILDLLQLTVALLFSALDGRNVNQGAPI